MELNVDIIRESVIYLFLAISHFFLFELSNC